MVKMRTNHGHLRIGICPTRAQSHTDGTPHTQGPVVMAPVLTYLRSAWIAVRTGVATAFVLPR